MPTQYNIRILQIRDLITMQCVIIVHCMEQNVLIVIIFIWSLSAPTLHSFYCHHVSHHTPGWQHVLGSGLLLVLCCSRFHHLVCDSVGSLVHTNRFLWQTHDEKIHSNNNAGAWFVFWSRVGDVVVMLCQNVYCLERLMKSFSLLMLCVSSEISARNTRSGAEMKYSHQQNLFH